MREQYTKLQDINNHMNKRFEQYKQELDHLQMKKNELEDVGSYERIHACTFSDNVTNLCLASI